LSSNQGEIKEQCASLSESPQRALPREAEFRNKRSRLSDSGREREGKINNDPWRGSEKRNFWVSVRTRMNVGKD